MSRKEYLEQNEMVVDRSRYAELQSMEFRHLGYVRAAEYMGALQNRHARLYRGAEASLATERSYHLGYLAAIKTMGEVQLRMLAQTIDAHPNHDATPGPFRKGQLCLVNETKCCCLVVARTNE